ncbi:hypothetical protein U1Q18_000352 [Sarracenia purpurea var. burkii]
MVALRAALQKLEEGCSMEDAKAVCEPGLLHQVVRWKVIADLLSYAVFPNLFYWVSFVGIEQ